MDSHTGRDFALQLTIAHLYPDLMNLYGDRGNILSLVQRCHWRGIAVELMAVHPGQHFDADWVDIVFMGGGQDAQQESIIRDLHHIKAKPLREAAENGTVFLTICGGYQLLGKYYRPHEGEELKGLEILDLHTVAGPKRMIGNITIERPNGQTVVGFENHSGLTYLGEGLQPLGKVINGHGNNGQDGGEGVQSDNLYGTYLHGSLLPKNPRLADEIIEKALKKNHRAQSLPPLAPLDDSLEDQAHQAAKALSNA
jgi:hypothetical protein